MYGQFHDIEITAACFDESEQLLVTGARDGTLKIWHFNTGTCLRNMELETQWYILIILCYFSIKSCSSHFYYLLLSYIISKYISYTFISLFYI